MRLWSETRRLRQSLVRRLTASEQCNMATYSKVLESTSVASKSKRADKALFPCRTWISKLFHIPHPQSSSGSLPRPQNNPNPDYASNECAQNAPN
jgi:hypothetical protein